MDLTLGHRYKKKNPRYASCGSLWAHCILQLSKRSVIDSGSDAVSKLQKDDVRSGHSRWPGVLTFQVRRSLITRNE